MPKLVFDKKKVTFWSIKNEKYQFDPQKCKICVKLFFDKD